MTTFPHKDAPPSYADDVLTGTSPAVERLRLQVARIAPHFRMALLTGEPGSGKHGIARQMHRSSPAADRPFIVIDSTDFVQHAKPPTSDGTVYLPGLNTLHPASQARFLRALKSLNREARVVVASQCDLKGLVSAGRMRHDLYETVGTLEIRVAPLRDRIEDVDHIALAMLGRLSASAALAPDARLRLRQHRWPGNLEELWAVCERLAQIGTVITKPDLPRFEAPIAEPPTPARLEHAMHRHVRDVLQSCAGNKLRAAEALGISRSTLYRILDSQPMNLS
jgi:DNA-binding NtrC family response regulator